MASAVLHAPERSKGRKKEKGMTTSGKQEALEGTFFSPSQSSIRSLAGVSDSRSPDELPDFEGQKVR